jgi:hypothetical protein
MLIQLDINIRTIVVSRKAFLKLLLDFAHSILVFFGDLFVIRINLCNIFPSGFFQYIVEIELIRQLDVEIDPALPISPMDVQQTLCPHLELVFSVLFVIGVDYLCELAV